MEKLIGPNYLDWIYTLRIRLMYENKVYVLDEDLPERDDESTDEDMATYNKH